MYYVDLLCLIFIKELNGAVEVVIGGETMSE